MERPRGVGTINGDGSDDDDDDDSGGDNDTDNAHAHSPGPRDSVRLLLREWAELLLMARLVSSRLGSVRSDRASLWERAFFGRSKTCKTCTGIAHCAESTLFPRRRRQRK